MLKLNHSLTWSTFIYLNYIQSFVLVLSYKYGANSVLTFSSQFCFLYFLFLSLIIYSMQISLLRSKSVLKCKSFLIHTNIKTAFIQIKRPILGPPLICQWCLSVASSATQLPSLSLALNCTMSAVEALRNYEAAAFRREQGAALSR